MDKNKSGKTKKKYEFINETLFFPKEKILVIGDLHLGYDLMLRDSGILLPEKEIKNVIQRFKDVLEKIKENGEKIEKIVFLGDIKHSFGFEFKERDEFDEVMGFLHSQGFEDEDIILIKGNHDTMDYSKTKKMKPYHIERQIAFIHGHKNYPKVFDKKIKYIVSGHLHPSVILEEKSGVKREMYKCFLTGKTNKRKKEFIILPSFLGMAEGTPVNHYKTDYMESFYILPKKDVLNASVHVIGDDKVYDFGKVKDF